MVLLALSIHHYLVLMPLVEEEEQLVEIMLPTICNAGPGGSGGGAR